MRITVNEIGQQQQQHTIETNQSELLPFLREACHTGGFGWLQQDELPAHVRVYINQEWVADLAHQSIKDEDIIDLVSPMAGG